MLENLNNGKSEDGSITISIDDANESLRLWSGRRTRVLHSIVNCAIALKVSYFLLFFSFPFYPAYCYMNRVSREFYYYCLFFV